MKVYTFESLNEYIGSKCLRIYQKLISENHEFLIQVNNIKYKFLKATIDGDRTLLFLSSVNTNEFFCLLSDEAGTGYKLSGSILRLDENMNRILQNNYLYNKTCIVIGHWNFAHYIWNQLSAFDFISPYEDFVYCHIKPSFGYVDEIVKKGFTRVSVARLDDYKNKIFLGGELLNSEVHKKLMESLLNKIGNFRYCLTKKLIYLGVRGPGIRELENEVDFYVELINTINESNNDIHFLIDGFSYLDTNKEIFSNRSNDIAHQINKIIYRSHKKNIEIIHGLHIIDALGFIKDIDFYITHEGTMHHKIAWFFKGKDGIILTGSPYPEATARWHASQVEGCRLPGFLPLGQASWGGNRQSPWRISDIAISAAYINSLLNGNRQN